MNVDVSYLKDCNKEQFVRLSKRSWISNDDLSAVYVNNGIIPFGKMLSLTDVCGGVLTKDLKPIKGSAFDEHSPIDSQLENIEQSDEKVIFIGVLIYVWGHLITDGLKRLWFLETDEGRKLLLQGYKISYSVATNTPLPRYAEELYNSLGYDFSSWLFVNKNTRFKEVVVPDSSMQIAEDGLRRLNVRFKSYMRMVMNRYNEGNNVNMQHDKVYLSRYPHPNDRFMGERYVEDEFRRLGYEIIHPEQLSISEQLSLYRNCKHLAATEGSIAHNAIFCKSGTKIEVVKTGDFINDYQWTVNELIDAEVTYIDAHKSLKINREIPNFWSIFYMVISYVESVCRSEI